MSNIDSLEEWLADRPQVIKDLARSHPPDGRYRLAGDSPDGDFYLIYSYHEDGTITVTRFARPGAVLDSPFARWNVFGVKPQDLVRIEEDYH